MLGPTAVRSRKLRQVPVGNEAHRGPPLYGGLTFLDEPGENLWRTLFKLWMKRS